MTDQLAARSAPASNLPRFEIVFLDMDGVLSAFQEAACKVHDRDMRALVDRGYWKPGSWDMPTAMGMDWNKFWFKIDEQPNFWHDMPKLPQADDVVKIARSISPKVRILSTPHNHDFSYAGKRDWVRRHFHDLKITLNEDCDGEKSKALLARPGRLLIDDRDENCDAFRAAGGSAILFPQHWNSAHDKAPFGPLFYLAQELAKLAAEQKCHRGRPALSSMGVQLISGLGEAIDPASHDGKEAETLFGRRDINRPLGPHGTKTTYGIDDPHTH